MPVCPICNRPLMAGEALIFDGTVIWHEVNVKAQKDNTLGRKAHTSSGWCGRAVRTMPNVQVTECPCGCSRDASIHTLTDEACAERFEWCSGEGLHHQYGHPGVDVANW